MMPIQNQSVQDTLDGFFRFFRNHHKPGAWDILDAGYTEPHRDYHSWVHIMDSTVKLADNLHLAARPEIIATAILWHDVVYKTRDEQGVYRPDIENVRDSAALFRQWTTLPEADADAVYELIMATGNHMRAIASPGRYEGFEKDLGLFLDLDLSSLSKPWEEFTKDTRRIYKEFEWVEKGLFCRERAEILANFNQSARLFRRDELNAQWGDQARSNLCHVIAILEQGVMPS